VPFLHLLYQNLIVEERAEIRDASLEAWKTALQIVSVMPGWIENNITPQIILGWYAIVMTPLGLPIDASAFYHPLVVVEGEAPPERHNVDKNMLAQDLSLITTEVILKARISGSTALALLMASWPADVNNFRPLSYTCKLTCFFSLWRWKPYFSQFCFTMSIRLVCFKTSFLP
jgi:TATA-binding protein-associated factor